MATVNAHTVIQSRLPLLLLLVPGIRQPTITLHQDRGTKILLRVPPVRRAGSGAARTENAFIKTIQLLALFLRLQVFLVIGARAVVLQVGLDGFVLLVEEREIRDDVLDDVGVGKGVDFGFLLGVRGNSACGLLAHVRERGDSDPDL